MLKSNPLNRPASFRFSFNRIINQNLIVSGIACLFFVLFVYAAISKLMDYQTFGNQIAQSAVLAPFANYLVWLVPVLELMIAGLLLSSRTMLTGLYACCTMMMFFSLYIFIILIFADIVPCSCGGVFANIEWKDHLLLNVALVMLAMAGITLRTQTESRYNF